MGQGETLRGVFSMSLEVDEGRKMSTIAQKLNHNKLVALLSRQGEKELKT